GQPPLIGDRGVVGLELQRRVEVGHGLVVVAQVVVELAAGDVGSGRLGAELDRLVEVGQGEVMLVPVAMPSGADEVGLGPDRAGAGRLETRATGNVGAGARSWPRRAGGSVARTWLLARACAWCSAAVQARFSDAVPRREAGISHSRLRGRTAPGTGSSTSPG